MITVGVEAFMQSTQHGEVDPGDATHKTLKSLNALGVSVFGYYWFIPEVGLVARYDLFNPNTDSNFPAAPTGTITSAAAYAYSLSRNYLVAGLTYRPDKNVQIIPNIQMETFQAPRNVPNAPSVDASVTLRLTLYWNVPLITRSVIQPHHRRKGQQMKKMNIVVTGRGSPRGGNVPRPAAQLKLNGAGATFPYVIYSKWFDTYHTKTGIEFNYQSIGSGGGIKQVIEGTVDFGASDAMLSDAQLKDASDKQGTQVLHIPTVMGAVVATYNIPGYTGELRLTPEVLAGIFLGDIHEVERPENYRGQPGKDVPRPGDHRCAPLRRERNVTLSSLTT
jgi:hypothetical protein